MAAIAPSILSADFSRLGEQVATVLDAGARTIHVDVMDGHFVPPITIGPLIVEALRDQTHDAGAKLDVHLMVEWPERHIAAFAQAGADNITIHAEATPHTAYALQTIRDAGCAAGLALNPGTPVQAVDALSGAYDQLLCMTVNPGWGGQPYLPTSDAKIAQLRDRIPDTATLAVDGGIDQTTAPRAIAAGATLLIAGSAIYGQPDPAAAYKQLAAL